MRANGVATAGFAVVMATALAAGCARREAPSADGSAPASADSADPSVTIYGDDRIARSLTWEIPEVALRPDALPATRERAAAALRSGRLYEDAGSAIPLYLAVLELAPGDAEANAGLQQALRALIRTGDEAIAAAGDEIDALRSARRIAAVARSTRPDDNAVRAYLARVDALDRLWELNREGERELRAGRYDEIDGALPRFREALRLRPGQARAMQGLAAVESGLIRRAEAQAERGDFAAAQRWLARAARVRPQAAGTPIPTIPDARVRIEGVRRARMARLRDEGLLALQQPGGIAAARVRLAQILRIAEPGDAAPAELRQRIELVTRYGLFRPGQRFTDALAGGGRSPELVVVPHGGFRMGAGKTEVDASDSERPDHYVRFDRGFAMSRNEVTVDDFRRFVSASGYRSRAARRGHSLVYDERSGNFVRRSGVDWQSDYVGARAAQSLPVLHVSARDAEAYAAWLSRQSGQRYRLPSEAEFEYALRAGGSGRFPWGEGTPPPRSGNFTGARDRSRGGRSWSNAFAGYGDGYWGPAPVGGFDANAYGLHDLAGNVSEWVADCWHDGYRRAPVDGAAWVNPGCRMRVIRGGAWASAPAQVRSAWRAVADVDTTNARIGFRVVREL